MKIITWNTQWCRGIDGRVDPARIVAEAKRLADFDVLCLQEIADNFADPRLGGSAGEDQFAAIASMLPGYVAIPGIAVDHPGDDGRRRRFGNMIVSRLPIRQVFRHLLPFPADPGVNGMPRLALEAAIVAPFGEVRVITTHLEWYSKKQRTAQVEALRQIHADGDAHARLGSITDTSGGPFHTHLRPASTIFTGDFNLEPVDPLHARMKAPFEGPTSRLVDAWEQLHPGVAHPTTFCLYMKMEPGGPELHCDFFFVSEDLNPRLQSIRVDQQTQASDHQPVILELG